jgi:guanylate kinase
MIILVGESGSGKTSAEKILEMMGFNRVISYTTRPKRGGEIEGVNYRYISKSIFKRLIYDNYFAEWVEYNGNYYGTSKRDCVDDAVIVVEPEGLKQLQENPDLKTMSFYLKADEAERFKRMTSGRNDSMDYAMDRIRKDRIVFKDIEQEVDFVIDANATLGEVVTDILTKFRGGKI